ncbi:MAG: CmpA/NrtA family ABC transporter substrate-binding protein, partial [Methyloligellaceae bacterium]
MKKNNAGSSFRVCILLLCFLGQLLFLSSLRAEVEKKDLTFAFIKLTDMAPLAIAVEKGFFADEGLTVKLVAKKSWRLLLNGVISGKYDGAHMLAGQPLAASIGYGPQAHIITPISMDLNGNGITVSNSVWAEMKKHLPKRPDGRPVHPIRAEYLKPVIEMYKAKEKVLKLGMVSPVSTHNYEFRYWLAAGGIHPGFYTRHNIQGQVAADVNLYVTPPPLMPTMIGVGVNDGYCVGEPWNQQAIFDGVGVPIVTDNQIWKRNPEKVFGFKAEFAQKYPKTTLAVVKALIRAGVWLDENNNGNRKEAVKILAMSKYVGAKEQVLANSMLGSFEFEKGDVRPAPDFNIFFRKYATYPYYSDAIWY